LPFRSSMNAPFEIDDYFKMLEGTAALNNTQERLRGRNDQPFHPRVEKRKADGYTCYMRFRHVRKVRRDFATA
jgi:hypothetical protein